MRSKKDIYRYNVHYNRKAYDAIAIRVKKGNRAKYDHAAKEAGMSLRAYIEAALEFAAMFPDFPKCIGYAEEIRKYLEEREEEE